MVISVNARHMIGTVLDTALRVVIILAVVMFVYKYALEAYEFGYRVFAEQPVSAQENAKKISIAVSEEATPMDIGKVLQSKGLIADARLFYVQEMFSGYHDELRPGIYELSSDMTAEEMMAVMSTVPEEDVDATAADAADRSPADNTDGEDSEDSGEEDSDSEGQEGTGEDAQ